MTGGWSAADPDRERDRLVAGNDGSVLMTAADMVESELIPDSAAAPDADERFLLGCSIRAAEDDDDDVNDNDPDSEALPAGSACCLRLGLRRRCCCFCLSSASC